ncbi:hypothetical protein COO60DRAFT_494285 [Scenedesmus sp. NREL 46B-D3]|nr:hypothetical protein COO60DRAFT_494285 [Scenedesmus sp. NREL 46B-D3]
MAAVWRNPLAFERSLSATYEPQQADEGRAKRKPRHRRTSSGSSDDSAAAEELPLAQRSPVAMGVVVATSLYCGAKAGIQGYQHLRRHNLRSLVRHVAPVLDQMGVRYFADFGTLLGMYREKDIIFYDNDADFVVLDPDWDGLLQGLRRRLPRSCRAFFVAPSEDRSIKWIRVMTGVGIMDLYGGFTSPQSSAAAEPRSSSPTERLAGAAAPDPAAAAAGPASVLGPMLCIPQGHGDLCDVPASLVFPLGTMKFRGTPVSVPGDVPGVLRYRYGDTFMVPRYMDKGRDCVEQGKLYARLLAALGKAGLRV